LVMSGSTGKIGGLAGLCQEPVGAPDSAMQVE
jgi:hypothetical protein